MSSVIPKTGGPYPYVEVNFGEFMGFQTAYIYWVAVLVGNASVVLALLSYLCVFFPQLAKPAYSLTVTIGSVWLFTLINITGIRSIGATQVVTTICKLLPLLALVLFGWGYFHPEYLTSSFNVTGTPHFSAFSRAAALTMWAFIGLESATIPAAASDNPKRNIPLATLLGVTIAAIFYAAVSAIVMGVVPNAVLVNSPAPIAAAAGIVFGPWGQWLVTIGAIISCCGTLNGWILVQGQIGMAAADDGLFPHLFSRRNKADMPTWSLIITSVLISILLLLTNAPNLVDQVQTLILVAITGSLIAYFYTTIAEVIWLIRHELHSKISKLHMLIALLAGLYSLWAFFGSGKSLVFYVAMLLFSSFPLYALVVWRKRHRKDLLG